MTAKGSAAPLLETPHDPGVKDVQLVPAESANLVLMFERLATNKDVDVEKLQQLIDMQKEIVRFQAKAEFEAEFAIMQGELPIIDEKGQIVVDGVVRSRFGRHEDIQEAIKPILARHGFSIRHRNVQLENGKLRIIGILSHRAGHSDEDQFDCPPDNSGKKNEIQALGSTREYGRRYTTISLLNIVTRGVDDDGQKAGKTQAPDPPQGYESWWSHLQTVAEKGLKAFEPAWETSDGIFKTYAHKHDTEGVKALKLKAAKAGKP